MPDDFRVNLKKWSFSEPSVVKNRGNSMKWHLREFEAEDMRNAVGALLVLSKAATVFMNYFIVAQGDLV